MPARVLIVVLLALNLGVAAWWLLRPAPPVRTVPASTAGGRPLELVAAPRGTTLAPPAPASPGTPLQCLRAGPFADRDQAAALATDLAGLVRAAVVEEVPGAAAGYRVLLPPSADREAAQALAARVAAAGFQDLFVLGPGAEAHAIALGAYRTREGADQRMQALRDAGFPAQLRPQGRAEPSQWWVELETTRGDDVRARLGDARASDCQLPPHAGVAGVAGTLR